MLLDVLHPLITPCSEELQENDEENNPISCHPPAFLRWTFIKVRAFFDNPFGIYSTVVIM